ncbi:GTP cyclohydrolase FolE2 [Thermosipho atlanticus]|uniref:GTP cyclohydrolase FolE2 n=1 Tax=Thermosipho atlanticus DSM 15807 TaxID=1123380 RepID=A0A1M5QNV7_9BACT|nr:GTP cyclohydrolase FolE2 [Thermosipho atlanticus]SHH15430.1 GTP cyclohydrolase I [Thermosipho atlanticus DSM 15807]
MLKDVQNEKDLRNIPLKHVGIKNLRYPIIVLDKKNKIQHTVADINMFVDLPKDFRGTHMSRFVEILNNFHFKIEPKTIKEILDDLKKSLNAQSAKIEISFPYFLKKEAPVTKIESFLEYKCGFKAYDNDKKYNFYLVVEVPVQTLCPCSKEISKYNAHNQRAKILIEVETYELIWFEELIAIAEHSASSPLYTLLKRPDEKHVTENAYENPKFVEDVARDVALKLKEDKRIKWFKVEVESYESIHTHNAYACVDSLTL